MNKIIGIRTRMLVALIVGVLGTCACFVVLADPPCPTQADGTSSKPVVVTPPGGKVKPAPGTGATGV